MRIQAAISRADHPVPRIEDVELEGPRAHEMLVRLVATGICHTDLNCHSGHGRAIPKPIVLGHEGSGVVEAIGSGIREFTVGDHVVMSGSSCGSCPACLSAQPSFCRHHISLNFGGARSDGSSPIHCGDEPISGAFFGQSSFATHAITSERTAVKVPKDVPLHLLGPLACGILTGAGAVLNTFRLRAGQSIAVFGAGSVGLAAIMAARLAGGVDIVAIDIDPRRLDLARELGATATLLSNAATASALRAIVPAGFDFSLNTTSAPAVYTAAFECLGIGGTAGIVTRPAGAWGPDMAALLTRGLKIQGILSGSANPKTFIPLIIDYWRQGRFPFDRLITEYDFTDIATAWAAASQGDVLKPVLRMT